MEENRAAEVRSVLAQRGLLVDRIEALSRPAYGRKSHRGTIRAVLNDGSSLKARYLESDEAASQLVDLRSRLGPSFGPIVGRHGDLLLERWIEGTELSPLQAAERAEDAGVILGQLHATGIPGNKSVDTRERRDRALEQLAYLERTGVVSPSAGRFLQAEVVRLDPAQTPRSIVHLDYCPENIVVDAHGALHVIDNEWITLDASGVDLGRTYSRWPMSAEVWQRFLKGYRAEATLDPGPLRFWMIVMAAAGAVVRLQKSPREVVMPAARLNELAVSLEGWD